MVKLFDVLFNLVVKRVYLDRPIFIWGAPRSGTSLLYQLIAKHPDVGYLDFGKGKPREGTGFWWRAFGEQRGAMDASMANPAAIQQICKEYALLLRERGKSRLLDKIPFMTLWIPLVNEVFPDARHFHIIRDGKAVVNSILYKIRYSKREKDRLFRESKLMFGPQPPELIDPMSLHPAIRHARQWIMLVEYGRCNVEMLGERYYELFYENLVVTTRSAMKLVIDHAQLAYDEHFLNEIFPESLENRNYKWKTDKQPLAEDGFTAHRAFEGEDIPYLKEMNPLLRLLGYQVL